MTAVTLTCETRLGVKTLLANAEWAEAYNALFHIKANDHDVFKIFDHAYGDLALIIKGSSLNNCSKVEKFQRLHMARKAYDMNLEANVFCPSVEV